MALALSLSLDLFLMKGNLFKAVESAARDGRTDGQGGKRGGQSNGERKTKEKKKKGRGHNRGTWLMLSQRAEGRDAERELSTWTTDTQSMQ